VHVQKGASSNSIRDAMFFCVSMFDLMNSLWCSLSAEEDITLATTNASVVFYPFLILPKLESDGYPF
jgi:hypothetical protein